MIGNSENRKNLCKKERSNLLSKITAVWNKGIRGKGDESWGISSEKSENSHLRKRNQAERAEKWNELCMIKNPEMKNGQLRRRGEK